LTVCAPFESPSILKTCFTEINFKVRSTTKCIRELTRHVIQKSITGGARLMNKIRILGDTVDEEGVVGFCSSEWRYGWVRRFVIGDNAAQVNSSSFAE
jgi:hypothetical protein